MISPAGHGHAPHTQTAPLLMAQPCYGTTAETETAGSVGIISQRDIKSESLVRCNVQ